MGKNDKLKLFITLPVIFIIFLIIIIAGFINRENIYNFLNGKNNNAETYDVLGSASVSKNADGTDGDIDINIETSDFSSSENINSQPPTTIWEAITTTEEIIIPPDIKTEPKIEITTEPPQEIKTEPETLPPPLVYIEAPKTDFIKTMFDCAIEIPGSQNKVEPPPEGRAVELQYGAVPLSETIPEPSTYFNNIILLGDSVTSGFDLYRNKINFNGAAVVKDMTVIAVGSYGIYNALKEVSENSIHPLLDGEQMPPEDIIAQKPAKNVFICLGLNDLTWQKTDNFLNYYATLINRIREKSPDKNVVIMSVTPVVFGQTISKLTNEIIMNANNALLRLAIDNNIQFIDYAAAIRDSQNSLYSDLSSDQHCHLTIAAYNRLVEYMLYHPIKN